MKFHCTSPTLKRNLPLNVQAKKIEEIHAEAHAELGMVPSLMQPLLSRFPLPAAAIGLKEEEVDLFPAFRGGGASFRHLLIPTLLIAIEISVSQKSAIE